MQPTQTPSYSTVALLFYCLLLFAVLCFIMTKRKRTVYRLSESQIAYIKEHYHDTPDQEIVDAIGISIYTLHVYRTKLGLRKGKEFMSRLNRAKALEHNNAAHINTPEAYAKRVETMAAIRESETRRVMWGLEQKTKLHIRLEPRQKLLQRNYLQRLGYIVDEKTLIAYYTAGTHRASRIEAIPRGTTKGSIHSYYDFRPYEDRRLD